MIRIEFTPADLVGVQFMHSPMAEVVTSCFALKLPSRYWMYASWRTRVAPMLDSPELRTFSAVVRGPNDYVPDFLTPVSTVARPRLDDELRVVSETPLDRVATEVDAVWAGHGKPPEIERFGTDPGGALTELVAQVRRYFDLAIAPYWGRLRAMVDADLVYRGRLVAERGPRALLADLHPRLDWDGSAVRLAYPMSGDFGLDGHRLALMATGFAGPKVITMMQGGRALWYPPRGYGQLWDGPAPVDPSAALAALLGNTRAAVLTLLGVPLSTGEVAAALRLAPATASHHLTTLRDAGLVVGDRVGRRLRYVRTPLGEQLAGSGEACPGLS